MTTGLGLGKFYPLHAGHLGLITFAQQRCDRLMVLVCAANKRLFVDTDLNITRSYSKFLFGKDLRVDKWVEAANQFDLYLYLENDAPYVQDGTRLDQQRRDALDTFHRQELTSRGIEFQRIQGGWEERFEQASLIIENWCYQ